MGFQLTIVDGQGTGRRFDFAGGPVTIGRGAASDLVLGDAGVSRNHARIDLRTNEWVLADGGSAFTDAVGLDFDASRFGMGKRSQRYSMIVDDGVVKALNIEAGGEFRVSAADYLLAQL